jgi:prepilin-type N-terminal cleavage/methylation domain-containing protein
MSARRRGFTLIELLVVIAIIGILAAMLFPVFARARESARKIQCLSNVKNIALAVQMYLTDYDRFPPDETRREVIDYFYSDGGTEGPGGCGVCNYHQTCETIGRPMDANPYLRTSRTATSGGARARSRRRAPATSSRTTTPAAGSST